MMLQQVSKGNFIKRGIMLLVIACFTLLSACAGVPAKDSTQEASSKSEGKTSGGNESAPLNWNSTDDPSLKGQEITVLWVNKPGPDSPKTKLVNQFTEQTGIKVKELGVDYGSLYNKITTAAMAASSDIDVIDMDTIWAGQFYQGNIAVDLRDIVPQEFKGTFTKAALSSMMYNEHLMAIPMYSATKHLYWNTELFKKAGIEKAPTTYAEFKEAAQKLKDIGVYAFGGGWKQGEHLNVDFITFLYGNGGQFFTDKGEIAFNNPEGIKALSFMVEMVQEGFLHPASVQWSGPDAQNAFAAGDIAMLSYWEGMYPFLNDPEKSTVVNKTDVGLMPGNGEGVVSAAVTGIEGLGIMKNSKKQQAALAFLKFITSEEFQLAEFIEEGSYPSVKAVYENPKLKEADKTNTVEKLQEQYEYGVNRPNAPGYVEWADILAAHVHKALLGEKTAEQALNEAAAEIEKLIKK
jgi:multiple sugar transport system substrate-binding protein